MFPPFHTPETSDGLPAVNDYVLHFEARSLPPFGYKTYEIQIVDSDSSGDHHTAKVTPPMPLSNDDNIVTTGAWELHFTAGKLSKVSNKVTGVESQFSFDYYYYKGYCGDGQHDGVKA
jgi:hypothetical protein